MQSSLYYKKRRIFFLAGFLVLVLIQSQVIKNFGFAWTVVLTDSLLTNLILALACIVMTNSMRFYMPAKSTYPVIIVWSLGLSGLWLFIIKLILKFVFKNNYLYTDFISHSLTVRFWVAVLIINWIAVNSMLWYKQQEDKNNEKRKGEIDKSAREAELYKLRQQLQPHFLFNSLNSINALIGSNPEQARKMINQLSDFLRGTLKKEEHQWVSLEDEMQHLRLYLEIEKVRFGYRLNTDIMLDETAGSLLLPPMLLQPVVENAIKFGLYDTTEAISISIHAKKENNYLVITVQNPFDAETSSPKAGTGFGLSSVHRRLYLLFARNDLLITSAENNLFTTIVKIPQHDKGTNY